MVEILGLGSGVGGVGPFWIAGAVVEFTKSSAAGVGV